MALSLEFQSVASPTGKDISTRQERPKEGYFRGTSSKGKASKLKEQPMVSMRSTGCGILLRNQRYLVRRKPVAVRRSWLSSKLLAVVSEFENAGGSHMLQFGLMTVDTIYSKQRSEAHEARLLSFAATVEWMKTSYNKHRASASSSHESIGNWLVDMRTEATWLYNNGPSTALSRYAVCVYRVFARVLTRNGNTDIAVNQKKGCEVEVICNLALTLENLKPAKPRPSHRTRAPIQAPLNRLGLRGQRWFTVIDEAKKLRFLQIPHPLKKHALVGMRSNNVPMRVQDPRLEPKDTDGPGGLKPWFATISTSINISELIIGRLNLSEPGTR
ncbi:hypothetical protein AN4679.2 [Aspergillus nidulans FGSC A4]|nr:hypothetical protein AN4679.2 [Aspergillus nidulans FGSC A4]|eukprot:XP_662283.1 hypothetical protein AN4679.2 [Aspergillus nidulans FGSC A4]